MLLAFSVAPSGTPAARAGSATAFRKRRIAGDSQS